MTYEEQKKTIHALIESGEIEYKEGFRLFGKLGGKKRWKGVSEKKKKEHSKIMNMAKTKL